MTTKSNIGSAIGGITAPIIGVVSSILLYLALTRQTQSNIDQRIKNESDIIFLLLNQLDNEISSFYYKYSQGKEKFKYHGIEGLNEFANEFRYHYDLKNFNFTFKAFFEANQFILIIRSYELIEKRIELSDLSTEMRELFRYKLKSFYDCRLKEQLLNINVALDDHDHLKDETSQKIQEFCRAQT